jgi:hypothetical protein
MKLNTGIMTVIKIGDTTIEIDGFIKKDFCKEFLPKKFVESLVWTNHLGETDIVLSEATFLEGTADVEVFVEEIDPYEKHIFSPLTSAIRALSQWYEINKKGSEIK